MRPKVGSRGSQQASDCAIRRPEALDATHGSDCHGGRAPQRARSTSINAHDNRVACVCYGQMLALPIQARRLSGNRSVHSRESMEKSRRAGVVLRDIHSLTNDCCRLAICRQPGGSLQFVVYMSGERDREALCEEAASSHTSPVLAIPRLCQTHCSSIS
jgi:hypothetical protein